MGVRHDANAGHLIGLAEGVRQRKPGAALADLEDRGLGHRVPVAVGLGDLLDLQAAPANRGLRVHVVVEADAGHGVRAALRVEERGELGVRRLVRGRLSQCEVPGAPVAHSRRAGVVVGAGRGAAEADVAPVAVAPGRPVGGQAALEGGREGACFGQEAEPTRQSRHHSPCCDHNVSRAGGVGFAQLHAHRVLVLAQDLRHRHAVQSDGSDVVAGADLPAFDGDGLAAADRGGAGRDAEEHACTGVGLSPVGAVAHVIVVRARVVRGGDACSLAVVAVADGRGGEKEGAGAVGLVVGGDAAGVGHHGAGAGGGGGVPAVAEVVLAHVVVSRSLSVVVGADVVPHLVG
mmetsp:Transcript_25201/g.55856  ORF Transcript_25201/g.55856 Transcript_25201/m.55856 type:complete len:347 (+) Transcript_25201:489-1529(+)